MNSDHIHLSLCWFSNLACTWHVPDKITKLIVLQAGGGMEWGGNLPPPLAHFTNNAFCIAVCINEILFDRKSLVGSHGVNSKLMEPIIFNCCHDLHCLCFALSFVSDILNVGVNFIDAELSFSLC